MSLNFKKIVALFCARKTIIPNWINCKDEYMEPKKMKTKQWEPSLRLSSSCKWKTDSVGKNIIGAIGWMLNMGNNVYENSVKVALFSSRYSHNGSAGIPILKENFKKVIALFCARKTIVGNWINDKDEYMAPNTN